MDSLFEWFGIVLVGGLASWIAALVMKSDKVKAMIIGMISAVVANMILPLVQSGAHEIDLNRKFLISFFSAFIVLLVIKLLSPKKHTHK